MLEKRLVVLERICEELEAEMETFNIPGTTIYTTKNDEEEARLIRLDNLLYEFQQAKARVEAELEEKKRF